MPAQTIPASGPSLALSTGSRTSGRASCFRVRARLGRLLVAPIVAGIDSIEAMARLQEIWPECVIEFAERLHADRHRDLSNAVISEVRIEASRKAAETIRLNPPGPVMTASEADDPLRRTAVPAL